MDDSDPHRLAEERSRAMHAAVAAKLRAEPTLVTRVRARVGAWRTDGSVHPDYVGAWERLLSLPLEELCGALVDPSEHARALRQVSPFAGLLTARERWAIHRQVGEAHTHDRSAVKPR